MTNRKSGPTEIGSTIRNLRNAKGLTLQQVSDLCGMQILAIRRVETSPTSNPQLLTLQKLAGALGVSVADLVKDVPVVEPVKGADDGK